MVESVISVLDSMSDPDDNNRPSSGRDSSDEVVKLLRDIAAPSPSMPRRQQPSVSSTDTLFVRTPVTRTVSSGNDRRPVYIASDDPMDDFLGLWDRDFRRKFMSILSDLSKLLGVGTDEFLEFPWNHRSTPRSMPRTTPRTTARTTPRTTARPAPKPTSAVPTNRNIPSVSNDETLPKGKTVETNSDEENDSRPTVDMNDGDIEIGGSRVAIGGSRVSTSSPSPSTSTSTTSTTTTVIPTTEMQPADQSNVNKPTAHTSVSDGISINKATSSQSDIQSTGDVKSNDESTLHGHTGERSDSKTSTTTELSVATSSSPSTVITGNKPAESDINVSSTAGPDNRDIAETSTEKTQAGNAGQSSAGLPNTTTESGDEIVVPEIPMTKYDSALNPNDLDEIEIRQLPPATISIPHQASDDGSDGTNKKTTNPTLAVADDEANKSNGVQDNEISGDDADDRKQWETPMGKLAPGRLFKKVVNKKE